VSRLEDKYLGKPIEGEISNDISVLYDNALDNSEKLKTYAADNDLDLVYPEPNEIFIDIDTDEGYELFKDQLEVLQQVVDAFVVRDTPSKSGLPKRHVVVSVRLPRSKNPDGIPTVLEKLALQTMLGSDRRCELLRYVKYIFKDPHPILFLEPRKLNA
jgi:hypothetical protein